MNTFPLLLALTQAFGAPAKTANLQDKFLDEVSGIVVSRTHKDIFWVHNDSGDGPFVYAVDKKGKCQATFRLQDAKAYDWEDMAYGPDQSGKGRYLYLADVGDNAKRRKEYRVYRIEEPKTLPPSSKQKPADPGKVTCIAFTYPERSRNCETLLVHPKTGDLYVITKEENGVSEVFQLPRKPGQFTLRTPPPVQLKKVGTITLEAEPDGISPYGDLSKLVTGGEISSDGKSVVFCSYRSIFLMRLPGSAKDFNAIWSVPHKRVLKFPEIRQWEAICFTPDGRKIEFVPEGEEAPIYESAVK